MPRPWACQTLERSIVQARFCLLTLEGCCFPPWQGVCCGAVICISKSFALPRQIFQSSPKDALFSKRLSLRRSNRAIDVQMADFIIRFENLSVPPCFWFSFGVGSKKAVRRNVSYGEQWKNIAFLFSLPNGKKTLFTAHASNFTRFKQ